MYCSIFKKKKLIVSNIIGEKIEKLIETGVLGHLVYVLKLHLFLFQSKIKKFF